MSFRILHAGPAIPDAVSILVVTFDSHGWRICGDLVKSLTCKRPKYWQHLKDLIGQLRPVVLVVASQNATRNAWFSKLPQLVDPMGYSSIYTLTHAELKLSVYLRDDNYVFFEVPAAPAYYQKNALAAYLTLPNGTRLALMNMFLPLDKQSVQRSLDKADPYIRANALAKQNVLFNQAYRKLILDSPADPNYVIVMGNLNYLKLTQDELLHKMQAQDIYTLQENTLTFDPTCNPGVPSYCDRILYQTYGEVPALHSLIYDKFETQLSSNHMATWNYFEFV